MFEEVALLGNSERRIALETKTGKPIPNLVEVEPGQREIDIFRRYVEKNGAHWQPRKSATGVYNCAGMVWACRRTSILEPSVWEEIIREDGYRWLQDGERPKPGDIAVYVLRDPVELYHVARVAFFETVAASGQSIPWVISKWNSTSGESVHRVHDVPFGKKHDAGVEYAIKYVTDRELKE
jgi:hypothetical protein